MSKARDLANAGTALTTVSATELGYLDGVTSAVQTQIDSKITGSSAIAPTIVDAKGDIIAASASDTVARLAVGSNDTVLTADSSTATGLKWAVPAGGANWTLLNAGGTTLTGASTITVSGISGKNELMVIITAATNSQYDARFTYRLNADSGANYNYYGTLQRVSSTYAASYQLVQNESGVTSIPAGKVGENTDTSTSGYLKISGCNSSGMKVFQAVNGVASNNVIVFENYNIGGFYSSSSTISSVSLIVNNGNFTGGKIFVYATA